MVGANPLVCMCGGPWSVALALYAAQTCRILLDLSIKEFLAPSQQTGVMDWSVVEHGQGLCLVEEERCGSVALPKGAGEH